MLTDDIEEVRDYLGTKFTDEVLAQLKPCLYYFVSSSNNGDEVQYAVWLTDYDMPDHVASY